MLRVNHLRESAAPLALVLAAGLLLLTNPAEAAHPGTNGKITFTSDRLTAGNPIPPGQTVPDNEIFTMNPDGSGQRNRTNNATPVDDYQPDWQPVQ